MQEPYDLSEPAASPDSTPHEAPTAKRTAAQTRDDYHRGIDALPAGEQAAVRRVADLIWTLTIKPPGGIGLKAFGLVAAELAALHEQGELLEDAPRVIVAHLKVDTSHS